MDVIITAGGIPKPSYPFYKYTQGKPKALIDIGGNIFFGWLGDGLDQQISSHGRVTMVQIGLFVSVFPLLGYLNAGSGSIPFLLLFDFLAGTVIRQPAKGSYGRCPMLFFLRSCAVAAVRSSTWQ